MLLIFPIILCSNSRRYHLLWFAFLPIMLESMIDIKVKKRLETISQCQSSVAEDYNGLFDSDSVWKGAGTSINPLKKQCWK